MMGLFRFVMNSLACDESIGKALEALLGSYSQSKRSLVFYEYQGRLVEG